MPFYTREQWEKLNNASVVDFAVQHGFKLERKSHSEYHVEGYGGLYIKTDGRFYCHSEQKGGGGVVQFAEQYCGMSKWDIMREYFGEGEQQRTLTPCSEAPPQNNAKKALAMPEKADNCKRVYAYLIKTRGLSVSLVNEFIKRGLIYQDNKGNAVFVHKDEHDSVYGADIRGTVTDVRYTGIASGSDASHGFEYIKGTPEKVYIFEAAIDMMSFIELHAEENNAKFVSMGGLKPNSVIGYINSETPVISCVDNDEAGESFNNRWKGNSNFTINRECRNAGVKDFNELLIQRKNLIAMRCNEIHLFCNETEEIVREQYSPTYSR